MKTQAKFLQFRKAFPSSFSALIVVAGIIYGDASSFKSYNSEAQKRFEVSSVLNIRHLNEIEPDPVHSELRGNFRTGSNSGPYQPNWPSLDSRPLPKWYDEKKIGIFIHWGVFSVLGKGAWFWECWKGSRQKECVDFAKKNFKPNFTYQEIAPDFTAEFFNPKDWADLFQKSGAGYVVLTTKHHEGFTLWPSKTAFGWNAIDVGPHRDLVGDLATAIRNNTSLNFGVYHSLYEWYNPLYLNDKKNNFTTDQFVRFKTMPELYELVETYKPDVIWSDGDWEASPEYWKSTEFLAWLYNTSPVKDTVVTNDRWGSGTTCKNGGFSTCVDRFNPGFLQPKKWENCMTLDKYAWAFRKTANVEDYLTPEELITTIIESVSCGGNILVNVGPTKEGMIVPIQQERLLQMGEWLKINGEAIYSSAPWTYQNDTVTPGVWYTSNRYKSQVYGMVTKWPESCGEKFADLYLGAVDGRRVSKMTMLGYEGELEFVDLGPTSGVRIKLPFRHEIKSKWAWVIVLQMV